MATLKQLNALADAIPVMSQKSATQARANQTVQLQQAVGGAQVQPGQNVNRMAQAAAPAAVAQDAATQAQLAQQTTQQLSQVGQLGLQTTATQAQNSLAAQERAQREGLATQQQQQQLNTARADIAMRKKVTGAEQAATQRLSKLGIDMDNRLQLMTVRQREQLTRLGADVRDKILDSRLKFERDDQGRKFSNWRQMADWELANAKTEVAFKDKLREMTQLQERKVQMLEMSERKIMEVIKRGWISAEQQLDNEQKAKLASMAAQMREKIEREKAEARNRASLITGAFTIGGAIIGGWLGSYAGATAPGAMAGAGVGQGVGMMAAGAMNGE